jgi:hypothetical protein
MSLREIGLIALNWHTSRRKHVHATAENTDPPVG